MGDIDGSSEKLRRLDTVIASLNEKIEHLLNRPNLYSPDMRCVITMFISLFEMRAIAEGMLPSSHNLGGDFQLHMADNGYPQDSPAMAEHLGDRSSRIGFTEVIRDFMLKWSHERRAGMVGGE